jgi:hypothetical protein
MREVRYPVQQIAAANMHHQLVTLATKEKERTTELLRTLSYVYRDKDSGKYMFDYSRDGETHSASFDTRDEALGAIKDIFDLCLTVFENLYPETK